MIVEHTGSVFMWQHGKVTYGPENMTHLRAWYWAWTVKKNIFFRGADVLAL